MAADEALAPAPKIQFLDDPKDFALTHGPEALPIVTIEGSMALDYERFAPVHDAETWTSDFFTTMEAEIAKESSGSRAPVISNRLSVCPEELDLLSRQHSHLYSVARSLARSGEPFIAQINTAI